MIHRIKHVRGGTWTIVHPDHGPIYGGLINRNEALRIGAALDKANINYTAPDAVRRINDVVGEVRNG